MCREGDVSGKNNAVFFSSSDFLVQKNIQTLIICKTSKMDSIVLVLVQRGEILVQFLVFPRVQKSIHTEKVSLVIVAEFPERITHFKLLTEILILNFFLRSQSTEHPVFFCCNGKIFHDQQEKNRNQYQKNGERDTSFPAVRLLRNLKDEQKVVSE